jgi:ATP-dependent RNA helicase DDX35
LLALKEERIPSDVLYLEDPAEDYVEKAVETTFNIHTYEADGDILVFLTRREEIDRVTQLLSERAATLYPKT